MVWERPPLVLGSAACYTVPPMTKKPIELLIRGVRYRYSIRPTNNAWTVEWSCLEPGCQRSWSETVKDRQEAELRANEVMINHGLESHAKGPGPDKR